jgi:IQ domain-containing protein H
MINSITHLLKENFRYALMSAKLYHSNLAVVHYSVFFQTCRALGIGYDIKEKQGTLFTLVDSLSHKYIGMITITDDLTSAMEQFIHNLKGIHQEISSDNMQGQTNFLVIF